MRIFLHILITIGKILLVALIVVACLIAALLFVPFGYRAHIRKDAETFDVRGRISWLFVVLRAELRYAGEQPEYEIRLFGIPLVRLARWVRDLRSGAEKRRAARSHTAAEAPVDPSPVREAPDEDPPRASRRPTVSPGRVTEETFRADADQEKVVDAGEEKTEADVDDDASHGSAQDDAERNPSDSRSFFTRVREAVAAFIRRIRLIMEKVREGYLLIKSPSFRRAVGQLKKRVLKILRHIRPRRIKGFVRFGFEDPSNTGKLLAVLSWIYPSIPRGLQLDPVFTDQTLDADVDIRGHLMLIVLLVQVIALLADRDVRKLFSGVLKKRKAA